MSRRRKKRSPEIALESLEPRTLLCGAISRLVEPVAVHDEFAWPASDGADFYEVWLNEAESNQLAFRKDGLSSPELDLQDIEDGEYFAWIQDENAGGEGLWRERQRIKVRDGKLMGSAGVLTWQPMAGADTYEVWISRDGRRIDRASGLNETSYQLPAMDDGNYHYWIQREDGGGHGDWNTRMTFAVQDGVRVEQATPGTLTWDSDDAAFAYEAWINSAETGERVAGAKALATSVFEVPHLEDGEYELWVRDEDASGNGTWRRRKPFLVEYGRLKATPTVGTVEWDGDPEARSYDIWVSRWTTGERVTGETGLVDAEFRLPELDDGVYDYWLRTETSAGMSQWGNKTTFRVVDGELTTAAPVGELSWETSPSAVSYDVWITSEEFGRNVFVQRDVVGEATEVSYLMDGLYSYWIKTTTADDTAWSDRQYLRVSNGNLRTSSGFLYWESDPTAVTYELEVTIVNENQDSVYQRSGITETRVDIPMLLDGSYRFRVQYEDRLGNGRWSEHVNFRIESGNVQTFRTGTSGSVFTDTVSIYTAFTGTSILCNEPVTLHL